jgi:hypothetical protein
MNIGMYTRKELQLAHFTGLVIGGATGFAVCLALCLAIGYFYT